MEVIGQRAGVSSLFLLYGFWESKAVTRLGSRSLYKIKTKVASQEIQQLTGKGFPAQAQTLVGTPVPTQCPASVTLALEEVKNKWIPGVYWPAS